MKVTRLEATEVHGYLPLNIEFFDDLTFLTGLNGCGKTSALRLLMALLTPNLEEFTSIEFKTAAATISEKGQQIVIRATRSPEGIQLQLSGIDEVLQISTAELQLLSESRRSDEPRNPVHEKISQHVVFQSIARISTPMFLGLDRRFVASIPFWEDSTETRRREYLGRRWIGNPAFRGSAAAGLADIHYLVITRMQEIRAAQENLDEVLRRKILTRAFEYKPSDITSENKLPSRSQLEGYKTRLANIERAAENLHLPVPELKAAVSHFFERMNEVVAALEKTAKQSKKKRMMAGQDFFDWIINKPQADRILEHIKLLDEYALDRSALHEPIDRFISLVNGFLQQTKKRLNVDARGEVHVFVENYDAPRPITALSSGERQLLVMLAHLSLNKNLAGSGVFIVDEPELSLHIDWQERFVDAIREANPSVQLIMATHSPAIILDRVNRCKTLS